MFKKLVYAVASATMAILVAVGISACEKGDAVASVSFEGEIKSEYARNDQIDISAISLNFTYESGKKESHSLPYEGVKVTGGDTSSTGEDLTLEVSYQGESKTFVYSVRNPILTLDFGEGTWEESKSVTISAENNYTDVSEYLPEADVFGYEFAGWFYDEAFTSPVKYNFGENKIDTSSDVTVYAGYDLNYSDKFIYEETPEGTINLTGLQLDMYFGVGELYIPATVKLRPVVKIADGFIDEDWASWLSYESLVFDENSSVIEIGEKSFYGLTNLEEIQLPATLKKIGKFAFSGTGIAEIAIPASVESIAESAFSMEQTLTRIIFAQNSKLNFLGESSFSYCSALSSISLPESVTTLSPYTFNYCTNLEKVYLGKNVKQIGLHAFASCSSLTAVTISKDNPNYKSIDGNIYSKDGTTFIRYCFGGSEEEFTLSEGVKSIYESAFDATEVNHMLKKINLPSTLTNINDYAFKELDADFTIPANVRYLSVNALTKYGGSKFVVKDGNAYFAAKDGVVYSSDFKTLIAVPERLEVETFTLDPRVETIETGAFIDNKNIRYFVIPANSSLKVLKAASFDLFNAENLGGIYIEKAEPFDMEENAFCETTDYANLSVSLYVSEKAKAAYEQKFSKVIFKDAVSLATRLISVSGAYSNALAKINELLSITEPVSETEFAEIVDEYINNILEFSYNGSFDMYTQFKSIYCVLDSAYYELKNSTVTAEADLTSAGLPFIEIFEEKSINAIADFYLEASDKQFARQKSFYLVQAHYLNLPESIADYLAGTAASFDEILARTDKFIAKQNYIITTANNLAANATDSAAFDIDLAAQVYADYEIYDTTLVRSRWSDFINISSLKCSLLINEFLDMPRTPENLSKIDDLLYEHFDEELSYNVLGITDYLESGTYFKAPLLKKKLYRYDEFKNAYERYISTERPEIIFAANEAVNNYDLTKFDYFEAFKVFKNYFINLQESDRNLDYLGKLYTIALRINIYAFNSTEMIQENYADACDTYLEIMAYYRDYVKDSCLPAADEALMERQFEALLRLVESNNEDFIAEIKKIEKDFSAADAEKFSMLYQTSDSICAYYPVTLTDADGEYETNASELFATLMILKLKKEIADTFDSVTVENYEEVSKYIDGYSMYDPDTFMTIYVNGINYYTYFMTLRCYNLFEKVVLSDAELTKYNILIDQYNTLTGQPDNTEF